MNDERVPCSQEGEIYTRRGLDREKKSQYVFTVMLEEKRPSTKVVSCLCPDPASPLTN